MEVWLLVGDVLERKKVLELEVVLMMLISSSEAKKFSEKSELIDRGLDDGFNFLAEVGDGVECGGFLILAGGGTFG